ncbi:MAG: hypothetical protein RIR39_999 [Pseudomonadota bacterium]
MNNLSSRILRMEQKKPNDRAPIEVIRLIVDMDSPMPIGYSCEGLDILKIEGETQERFTQRLFDSGGYIYQPIYSK